MVLAKDLNLPEAPLANAWETQLAENQSDEIWEDEDVILPPSDLWSDEPPLESEWHLRQLLLLIQCLELWWQDRQDFYAFGNLTIYYSARRIKSEKFRGPDFFVVLNTERKPRKSWVVWNEDGKYPNVIVEILSKSTAQVDRVTKKQLYQDTFRTPNYFWFDPAHPEEFKGFHLVNGQYEAIVPNAAGWLWSEQLELYFGVQESVLRLFTPEGHLIPTPEEANAQASQQAEQERQRAEQERQRAEQERQRAEQERQRAEQERQRAEQERQRAEQVETQLHQERQRADQEHERAKRLAQKLRELGINDSEDENLGDL